LLLDFSGINRDPDPGIAKAGLFDMINGAIERFYATYADYLGNNTDEQLIAKNIVTGNAIYSLTKCITVVQKVLRKVPRGDKNHPLAGVKGVNILI